MTSLVEQRLIRLQNDYQEMRNLIGPIVQWRALEGREPAVEKYEVTVRIRTITGPSPSYRDLNTLVLYLPPAYPHQSAPVITMVTQPVPFHPNWFNSGHWCFGKWVISEGLGHHVVRMMRTLQYDLEITNEQSPANQEANAWYLARKNSGLFPCDRQTLPDPTGNSQRKRFTVTESPPARTRFQIQD